jgi:organic hydroperoxide reductase OsmC/OhrA
MGDAVSQFTVKIDQVTDYEFRVKFDKEQYGRMTLDEPPPLGKDGGPSSSRLLAAAVSHCLSASLLFCARKHGVTLRDIHTEATVEIVRNENRRLRVGKVRVTIEPKLDDADREKALGCLDLFEDFCTVTQSIRRGIDVEVQVKGVQPL